MNLSVVVVPAKMLADGTHKIRIAISHNSETRYYVTRFLVPSPKNIKNGKVIGNVENSDYINQQLSSIIQKMYRAYDKINNVDCYSCSQLLALIQEKMNKTIPTSFSQLADEWLELKKKDCSVGSIDIYKLSIKSFKNFLLDVYCKKDILLPMITIDVVHDYDIYLSNHVAQKRNGESVEDGKKISNTTININMYALRSVIKYAIDRKYIDYDVHPFTGYKKKNKIIRDLFLSVESIRNIRDAILWDEHEIISRDIFMLSFYLCGMNLKDMLAIDFSSPSVCFSRIKTQNRTTDALNTSFTIQPEARVIIDKYIQPDGHLYFKGKNSENTVYWFVYNFLPKLQQYVVDDKKLKFYCTRKSFTQFANELKIQPNIIKYCIGDSLTSNDKDVLTFYTKTIKQMADEAIRSVFDFIASDKSEESLFQSATPS